MSDLSPRIEPEPSAAVQRAQLLEFVDGFKRECALEPRIAFREVDIRKPVEGDELIIFIQFTVDGIPRVAAVDYHLPDPTYGYFEYGMVCGARLKASIGPDRLSVLHHQV